jgi:hypothetical protein
MSYEETSRGDKKLFFHLLNMAVYNAFVIYEMQHNISCHLSDFRLEIIREILTKYGPQRSTTIGSPSISDSPLRLTTRYFPSLVPQTSQSKQSQRKCVVFTSHNIRRDTRYMCPDCFKDYHTEMSY